VLSNGENVEPVPVEDVLLERCPLVDQVMVTGQDQRFLGALVVVNPKVRKAESDG
jgi:long-chain acyl-CoA synthetase